jgi:5-aminopentanamidase
MPFRVGFVQFAPIQSDVEQNIARLQALLAGVKADVLVLPELANSGYLHASADALRPFSEPGDGSGRFLRAVRELAQDTGGLIVAGFCRKNRAGAV